jgi:hypothetical protein
MIKNKKTFEGNFSVNDWIKEDIKGFSFQIANKGKAKHKFFVMLNPYKSITKCGIIPKYLQKGDEIIDTEGIILKVVDFGSEGLFGENSFSWIWVGFSLINTKFE